MVRLNRGLVRGDQQGQAFVEYILLVAIVTGFFVAVFKGLSSAGVMAKLMAPLQKDFAKSYQHGHPEALGFDDGGPKKHPRAVGGTDNFRIFYVKKK